ncbi:unnamed protein product [Lepeophtheirus salmonis]|uniref:(salmon louse) hypothetical protein n=1 Tax=Lepeophtheirus salmonis TaxID=72036 RepID=A0A7R8CBL4_LEPSM|nr:unnamed protein product [Lepeophtheirus salmonis]CAF2761568.1 unnamed protein product [Lepeophtheirus salmonis]
MGINKFLSFNNSLLVIFFIILLSISLSTNLKRVKRNDLVRCGLTESVCKWTCRLGGHSGGFCSPDADGGSSCICSEEDLEKYVCGGDVGPEIAGYSCAGFCQAKGRQSGNCDLIKNECACTKEYLQLSHIKCINDEVCSVFCQYKERKANGRCEGPNKWDCKCYSMKELNLL